MTSTQANTTVGDLVAEVYEAFMETYGDEELARVGTAMLLNRILSRPAPADARTKAA